MNSLLSKLKVGVIVSTAAISCASPLAYAVQDLLETTSAQTELAASHLLLDVAKAGSRLVAVGGRGHIIYSDDSGVSWVQAQVPVSTLLTAVSFVDAQNGWAVGHSGVILHSQDGGETWAKQFDGDSANKMIITQSENALAELERAVEQASEDDLEELEYKLEEAEYAVEDAKADAQVGASKPLLDVLFSSREEGFAVGAYGFLFKTNDGGKTWENYGDRIDNLDRFHLNAITKIKGGALFIVGEGGTMYRSTDDGESWDTLDSPYEGSFFGVSGTYDREVVLAFGLRGNMFRSEDNGDSWERVETNTEGTLMSASTDGRKKISVVGNSGVVIMSSDGGRSFSETIRENRLGNSSAVYIDSERLVMVGENGVNLIAPNGLNL
jgi:photosystem II stability/assembly factor-like uncharacterized protein